MAAVHCLALLLPLLTAGAAAARQDALPTTQTPAEILALGEAQARMTVPVSVAGSAPYPFVIDTGADRSVVSRQLASVLGLRAGPKLRVTAMTGVSNESSVIVPSITVGPIQDQRPFSAPALEALHLGAHGLLGIAQLQTHRVSIDFVSGSMSVQPSSRRQRAMRSSPGEIVVQAKSVFGQLIVTEADFDGTRVRVVLDTGSQVSLGNNALRRRLGGRLKPLGEVTLTAVTGAQLTAPYALAGKVTIGGVTMTGLPVAFADVDPFARFGLSDKPALMLGMDALRAFRRVDIDFPNRQVRFLLPRPGAGIPAGPATG